MIPMINLEAAIELAKTEIAKATQGMVDEDKKGDSRDQDAFTNHFGNMAYFKGQLEAFELIKKAAEVLK